MDQKPPFLIPLTLDIERRGGKRDPDGVGADPIAPGVAVISTDDQRLLHLSEPPQSLCVMSG
jgi:hypothetical protein